MARAPRIRNPGGNHIPTGYILGRTDGRVGDVQLLAISQFQQIAGAGAIVSTGTTGTAVAALSIFAVANTTQSTTSATIAASLSFAGAGAVSVGVSGSSVVVSSPATVASASTMNLTATGNTTGSSSATTRAITGETLSGLGGVSVGFSGNTILISGATTVASASTMNVTALGNTTGSSSATTRLITAESISFTGGVSGGWSGNTLVISGATAAGATSMNMTATGNTTGSSSATTRDISNVTFSFAGDISGGFSGNTIVISGTAPVASATSMGLSALGNTTGTTSSMTKALTAESISFAGAISGGFNAGTFVISAATGSAASAFATLSMWDTQAGGLTSNTISSTAMTMMPLNLAAVLTINEFRFVNAPLFSFGSVRVATTAVSSKTFTVSQSYQETCSLVRYSRVDATTFTSVDNTTMVSGMYEAWAVSISGSSQSISRTHSFSWAAGTTTSSSSASTSLASNNVGSTYSTAPVNSTFTALFGAGQAMHIPWATAFQPGQYMLGILFSTGTTTAADTGALLNTAGAYHRGIFCVTQTTILNMRSGPGDANQTQQLVFGMGMTTGAGGTAPTSVIATSLLGGANASFIPYYQAGLF